MAGILTSRARQASGQGARRSCANALRNAVLEISATASPIGLIVGGAVKSGGGGDRQDTAPLQVDATRVTPRNRATVFDEIPRRSTTNVCQVQWGRGGKEER
jgi:hypothetical protein